MDKITELMLQLLRCSLNGQRPQLSDISTDDWEKLYWLSRKHGVVTIIFDVIEKLPEAQKPQGDIALSWELSAERTRFHYNHQSEVLQSLRQKTRQEEACYYLRRYECGASGSRPKESKAEPRKLRIH